MPLNLNQVTVAGTLTRDPGVTYTPKGTAVAKFSLAINRTWKDGDGKKHEKADFIDCEAWGKTAETIGEWTAKGHCILIEGRLQLDQWENKDGEKRSKIKVVTERMHFVSKPKPRDGEGDDSGEDDPPPPKARTRPTPPQRNPVDPDLDAPEEDDIPF